MINCFSFCKPKIRIVSTGKNSHLSFVKVQNQAYSIKQAQDLLLQHSYPDLTWECDKRNWMFYVGYCKGTFQMQILKQCNNSSMEEVMNTFLCLMEQHIWRICYTLSNTDLGFSVLPKISIPSTLRMEYEEKSRT